MTIRGGLVALFVVLPIGLLGGWLRRVLSCQELFLNWARADIASLAGSRRQDVEGTHFGRPTPRICGRALPTAVSAAQLQLAKKPKAHRQRSPCGFAAIAARAGV